MDTDSDPAVAMKASGFYTVSKQPYLDAQLTRNYADAIRLGKVPILYHFAGGADPTAEANYFIEALKPLAEGDVYALDWEIDVADPVNWVHTFVSRVHEVTGVWPLVYMDISRANSFDWAPVFNNCGYWCAAPSFGFDATLPVKYPQVAQQGPIVNGVDTDAFFGTVEELKKYGYHAPATPAPQPAPAPAPEPVVEPTPVVEPPVVEPTPAPVVTPNTPPVVVVSPPIHKLSLLERLIAFIKLIFIGRK
jgi:hypothetical protein